MTSSDIELSLIELRAVFHSNLYKSRPRRPVALYRPSLLKPFASLVFGLASSTASCLHLRHYSYSGVLGESQPCLEVCEGIRSYR